jgi:Tfp pilus assembly protein PilW
MYVGRRISIREERGTTLVELLVAITAGVVVLAAVSAVAIASMRQTARISTQVEATQRARLVLGRVVEELHSACLAPEIAPVRENSSGTELRFLHQTGSAVAPTPILSKITLSGGTLTQTNYAETGGSAPLWTFNEATPTSTETLMTKISPTAPSPSIFSYYSYSNGVISPTPLVTPLSKSNASITTQVSIALTAAPPNTPVIYESAAANVQNSVLLRFSPASYNTSVSDLPCQ